MSRIIQGQSGANTFQSLHRRSGSINRDAILENRESVEDGA